MREQALGRHLIVEVWGADPHVLDDVTALEQLLLEAARAAHATVIESVFHHFSPYGVSGVVVIAESHLTIHTWPEYGYAAIDIFTCGPKMDLEAAVDVIARGLGGRMLQLEISRGKAVLRDARPSYAPTAASVAGTAN
uniref:S-adenosylmethionine decarboxylase proenzyme n=2 Tax=Candidatus Bipolaricaulota TaxID=67810 RepID=H5SF62_9BACT|nr:spermidine synthase [uncultured Acetothermia bacterium]BAL59878.1 spermidine synthase [Candidatus Acetothermum autotrophicum]